jgi:hypothetical protein
VCRLAYWGSSRVALLIKSRNCGAAIGMIRSELLRQARVAMARDGRSFMFAATTLIQSHI